MNYQIGKICKRVIEILNLDYTDEKTIYIGNSNIEHIKLRHPIDYEKYGMKIEEIINHPTYLARNEKKNSIEFIKKYKINNDFVLVAVRVSNNNIHFVRTMYVMSEEKIEKYFKHHYFYKFEWLDLKKK